MSQEWIYTIVYLAWLAGASCFVLGLHRMNSPATARDGNRLSAAGMTVAVVATLLYLITREGGLSGIAEEWLASLPPRYRPLTTAQRHPHVVNRLAALWEKPLSLPAYFDELLLSDRPGRAGFSFEVLTELGDLRSLLELAMHRARQ
jgi:hypothetical protein